MASSELAEIKAFWIKVLDAFSRLVALALFLLTHKGLDVGLRWVVPAYMNGMLKFAESIMVILFTAVYVYLCWDMVTVFIPKLKRAWLQPPVPK